MSLTHLPRIFMRASVIAVLAASNAVVIAHQTTDAMSAGSTALHQLMADGMQKSKAMKMTGNVDKDFAAMMIEHHQQAIDMVKVETEKGSNSELKAMAQKMADQQQKEIEELKRFTQ